jgi:hypothetical protein
MCSRRFQQSCRHDTHHGSVVGTMGGTQLRLWDSAGQMRSSEIFKVNHGRDDDWSMSFTPEGHRCGVRIENHEKGTSEAHEWTISNAGIEKIETEMVQNAVTSPDMDACRRPRELLFHGKGSRRLAVCTSARGEEEHCTCTAVARFDDVIRNYCARTKLPSPGGPDTSARNHSTVAVGLRDGSVHFMEFRV